MPTFVRRAAPILLAAALLAAVPARSAAAPASDPEAPFTTAPTVPAPKVTCIGDGASGRRIELLYVRRASTPSRYAAVERQLQAVAANLEQMVVRSAAKTGGALVARFAHDDACVATVRSVIVPESTIGFDSLAAALAELGFTASDRKFLVAWDDPTDDSFCGKALEFRDSQPGSANLNERNETASIGAVDEHCWSSAVFSHELMHSLGAVQPDAPHAINGLHCNQGHDPMCDADTEIDDPLCPLADEALFDCGDDDYFAANPAPGSYLDTHWNTARSTFLQPDPPPGPPAGGFAPSIVPGPSSVTVTWDAPTHDGGSPVTAYLVALSNGRTVVVPASQHSLTIDGLEDGIAVSASVAAINAQGNGAGNRTPDVVPSPLVETIASAADGRDWNDIASGPNGSVYVARRDSIVRLDADGTVTTVVGGSATGEGTAALNTRVRPRELAVAPDGDLYWFDAGTGTLRRLHLGGVTTVAGSGAAGAGGDGGAALDAQLVVDGLAIGADSRTVYLTDATNHVVRMFTVDGSIRTVAGTPGVPTTTSSAPLGDGGPASAAHLNGPQDLVVDSTGGTDILFVADTGDNRVRRFTVDGTIETVAGSGSATSRPDNVLDASAAGVAFPRMLAWSDDGLSVSSSGMVRQLVDGRLRRVAGEPFVPGTPVDGAPASVTDLTLDERLVALAWSGDSLFVLSNGASGSGSPGGRVRRIGRWSPAAMPEVASALLAAPTARPAPGSALATWPPAGNGGSPITGYRITVSDGTALTVGPNVLSARLTGLTPGRAYTFTVTPVSDLGDGGVSAPSAPTVPTGDLPDGAEGEPYRSPDPGGAPGSTWRTTGPLPEGLSLDPPTGTISGIPSPGSAGTHRVTLVETDLAGRSFPFDTDLVVLPQAPAAPLADPRMVVLIGLVGALVAGVGCRRARPAGRP